LVLYIKKKLRDQAKMNIPTYQFLREKAEKRNIDPTSPLVFIEPDKKETI
ncbi:lecithin retinol acyltransferase family protein, partial [Acinetobacter baumannii]|nr:phosphatidylcholine--retinol O-acyltransferase [Acinetobacter baumannii]